LPGIPALALRKLGLGLDAFGGGDQNAHRLREGDGSGTHRRLRPWPDNREVSLAHQLVALAALAPVLMASSRKSGDASMHRLARFTAFIFASPSRHI